MPHALSCVIGYGVRLAKDMGAHRRGTYGPRLTVEEELKKRAFWLVHPPYYLKNRGGDLVA